jgi:hypothetical protein
MVLHGVAAVKSVLIFPVKDQRPRTNAVAVNLGLVLAKNQTADQDQSAVGKMPMAV